MTVMIEPLWVKMSIMHTYGDWRDAYEDFQQAGLSY